MARTHDKSQLPARPGKPVEVSWEMLGAARFFLALVVVAVHVRLRPGSHPGIDALADCSGYMAILGFLIISGFSIAHSITRQPVGFYRRRFHRIYPLYFLAIVLPLLLHAMHAPVTGSARTNAVLNLFFLQSFTTSQTVYNPVVWTLAVEMACYLLAPWLSRRRSALLVLLGAASAGFFVYAAFVKLPYPSINSNGEPLLVTAWAWIAGFVFYRFHRAKGAPLVLGASIFAVIWISGLHFERFYLVSILVVIAAFIVRKSIHLPRATRAVLTFSGDISYPLYLFHVPTIWMMITWMHATSDFVFVGGAVAAAATLTVFEIAAKRSGRHLFGKPDTPESTAVEPTVPASLST